MALDSLDMHSGIAQIDALPRNAEVGGSPATVSTASPVAVSPLSTSLGTAVGWPEDWLMVGNG